MVVHKSRCGSLQVWPRSRARKIIPSANWNGLPIRDKISLTGFIGYKVGMASLYAKDNTPDSMTKGKKVAIPVTILECPELKIYSVRFYKNKKIVRDVIVNFEEELKKKLKKPKEIKQGMIEEIKDFDDLRVIVFSDWKKIGIKRSAPLLEIALNGKKEEKFNFIKERLNKGISIQEVFPEGVVDVHAVTKAYGTMGPVKRFGISLKFHKSEKGVRRPGSLAPWHPARVTFRTSNMGQTGFFTRVSYNNLIIKTGKLSEKDINKNQGYYNYGKINGDYLILKGSVSGTTKRPILLTVPQRPNKKITKQKFELIELR